MKISELDALKFDWREFRPVEALRLLPAVAACLVVGARMDHVAAGMVAAGGAVSVGFGSFQELRGSRLAPMLSASVGMCASTLLGTLVGRSAAALACAAGAWGFVCGVLSADGPGFSWVGTQCAIALLVASSFPADAAGAAGRGVLVLGGGLLQTLFTLAAARLHRRLDPAWRASSGREWNDVFTVIRREIAARSPAFRYGARQAATLALTAGVAHRYSRPNGYWVPMTALLVLKPAFNQTLSRGVARTLGTLAGVALATLLAARLEPGTGTLIALVLLFAWLGYCFLSVNYPTYATFVTIYVVFLLALAGLPAAQTAAHRALYTTLGGACALLAFTVQDFSDRRRAAPVR